MGKTFKTFFSLMLLVGLFFNVQISFSETIIYQSVEPDGTTLFSDTPSKNSNEITLEGALNTSNTGTTGKNATQARSALSGVTPTATATQYTLKITSPEDQATFQNQLPIPIIVDVQPAGLQNDGKLQLIVDGKPYGTPQSATTLIIDGSTLSRGTHQVQAGIFDADTKSITIVSLPITIFKHQASVLLPVKGP